MFLRNHGVVICGETIEEAVSLAENAVKACKYQVKHFNMCKTAMQVTVYLQVMAKS